jgi:hypothetical protein
VSTLAAVRTCQRCGLAGLPSHARFCASCGAPLAAAPGAPVWVLVLFWLGAAGALGLGLIYVLVAIFPDLAGAGSDAARTRSGQVLLAACFLSLSAAQIAAVIGLMTGRPWSRPLATLVCVAWALTCLGLPVALLALNAIWRPLRAANAGRSP